MLLKSVKKQLQNRDDISFEIDRLPDLTNELVITKLRGEIWKFSDEVMHRIDYAVKNKILGLIKNKNK
jgi:hypothetical protein